MSSSGVFRRVLLVFAKEGFLGLTTTGFSSAGILHNKGKERQGQELVNSKWKTEALAKCPLAGISFGVVMGTGWCVVC